MAQFNNSNIKIIRKCLKNNVINDMEFIGNEKERNTVLDLLQKTIKNAESNSALLIGPRGVGKTALVNSVLDELTTTKCFEKEAVLVRLHGLVHTDDRLALKSITIQMKLENAVDGKVFGSFAENLAFLLACLKAGDKKSSKSVVFIIDDFDLFCSHHNQTLLYNLFDVSQSAQAPICVLGLTCRLDVIELLEKRVKSRFSHRQIFLFPELQDVDDDIPETSLNKIERWLKILDAYDNELPPSVSKAWNKQIDILLADKGFKDLIQRLFDITTDSKVIKNIIFMVASDLTELNKDKNLKLKLFELFEEQIKQYEADDLISVLQDLSVLELCLIIAMKHHSEIYDNQPMNFEMVLTRYSKFVNSNSNMQAVPRPVILKAFEHIQKMELISFTTPSGRVQKEYQLFNLLVTSQQIAEAVSKSPHLPTEIVHWATSSLV